MRRWVLPLLVCVLIVGAGVLFWGCQEPEPYPETYRSNFLWACDLTGGLPSECLCAFEWFEDNVALRDFVAEEVQFNLRGEMTDRIAAWWGEAVAHCVLP